jgi:hypothetical protein
MKISTGVQEILRVGLRNLRNHNVGITDLEGYIIYMKCAVDIGSDAMTYIPIFINIGSGTKKLLVWDNHTDIQTQRDTR